MNETDQEVISILLKALGSATFFYTCSLLGKSFVILVGISKSGLSVNIVQGSCSPALIKALKVAACVTVGLYSIEGIYYLWKKYKNEDVKFGDLIINPYILGMYKKDLVITTKEEKYNSYYNSPFNPNAELEIITNCGESIWEPGYFEIWKNNWFKWWNNVKNDKNEYTEHAILNTILTDGYIAESHQSEFDLTYLDDSDMIINQKLEDDFNYALEKFIKKYQKVWSYHKRESDKFKNKLDNDILQLEIQQTKDIYFDEIDKLVQLFNYQYDFSNLINLKTIRFTISF